MVALGFGVRGTVPVESVRGTRIATVDRVRCDTTGETLALELGLSTGAVVHVPRSWVDWLTLEVGAHVRPDGVMTVGMVRFRHALAGWVEFAGAEVPA